MTAMTSWLKSEVTERWFFAAERILTLAQGLFNTALAFVANNAMALAAAGLAGISIVGAVVDHSEQQAIDARLKTDAAELATLDDVVAEIDDEPRPRIVFNAERPVSPAGACEEAVVESLVLVARDEAHQPNG